MILPLQVSILWPRHLLQQKKFCRVGARCRDRIRHLPVLLVFNLAGARQRTRNASLIKMDLTRLVGFSAEPWSTLLDGDDQQD